MSYLGIGKQLLALFDASERKRLFLLVLLAIASGIVETASIVSVIPFLTIATTPQTLHDSAALEELYKWVGAQSTIQFLMILGLVTIGFVLFSNAISSLNAWAMFRFTYNHGYRLGRRLFSGYIQQPYEFFLTANTVDLGRNVYDEIPRLMTGVVLPALQVVSKAVSVLFILIVLVSVNLALALVALCTFGGTYLLLHTFTQRRLEHVREIASQSRALALRRASEALAGIKELKVLGREQWCIETYSQPALAVANADAKNQLFCTMPRYLLEAIAFGGVVALALFLLATQESAATALSVIALYALAGYRMIPALQQIYSNLTYVHYYYPSLQLVSSHLAQIDANKPLAHEEEAPSSSKVNMSDGVTFDRVTFRYPATNAPVLCEISLNVPTNSFVGIVGRTGSGKSTLLDLLSGLLHPSEGQILVDGVLLTSSNLRAWQSNIGYVPQHVFLSDSTIAANIALGSPESEVDMDCAVRAARAAQLHEFVQGLPLGYQTLVGERGASLSGGQRQRIGIARALYTNPKLLVLDEATSALDHLTEAAVMQSLRRLAEGITVVLAAHRLTTLRLCDKIILLASGRFEREGTYEQLLVTSSLFRELDTAGRSGSLVMASQISD